MVIISLEEEEEGDFYMFYGKQLVTILKKLVPLLCLTSQFIYTYRDA